MTQHTGIAAMEIPVGSPVKFDARGEWVIADADDCWGFAISAGNVLTAVPRKC